MDISIAAGKHRIRIERDGFVPFEKEIDVKPGADVRETDVRLEER